MSGSGADVGRPRWGGRLTPRGEIPLQREGQGQSWGGGNCSPGVMVMLPFLPQVSPTERQWLALARRLLPVLLPLHLG